MSDLYIVLDLRWMLSDALDHVAPIPPYSRLTIHLPRIQPHARGGQT
jgi:hypothetical protein